MRKVNLSRATSFTNNWSPDLILQRQISNSSQEQRNLESQLSFLMNTFLQLNFFEVRRQMPQFQFPRKNLSHTFGASVRTIDRTTLCRTVKNKDFWSNRFESLFSGKTCDPWFQPPLYARAFQWLHLMNFKSVGQINEMRKWETFSAHCYTT